MRLFWYMASYTLLPGRIPAALITGLAAADLVYTGSSLLLGSTSLGAALLAFKVVGAASYLLN